MAIPGLVGQQSVSLNHFRFAFQSQPREVLIDPYEDRAYQIEVFDGDDRLGQANSNGEIGQSASDLNPKKPILSLSKSPGCEGEECNGVWVGIEEVKFR